MGKYVDSWGFDRGYRGDAGSDRVHEGTDIMCINNVEGLYPVVSVCDGTVTKKGWLELGGYRIGITSENKIYYYYAHLSSYAQGLEVGDTVKAGQLLGVLRKHWLFQNRRDKRQVSGTSSFWNLLCGR